jgi:PAS domain S-box-containing protein
VRLSGTRLTGAGAGPRLPAWLAVLVLGSVTIAAYATVGDRLVASSLIAGLVAAGAAAVLVACAARAPARTRGAWALIAASQALWAAGDVIWIAIELSGGSPYPSIADVPYVLGYPFLALGLGMLLRSTSRGFGAGDLVDVAIVTLAWGLVLWPVVFQPNLVDGPSWAAVTAVGYSSGDVVLLGLLAALFFQGGRRAPAIWLLACSLVLVFVADLVYYVPTIGESAAAESWSNSAWLAAYVLVAVAGLHPSASREGRRPERAAGESSLRRMRFVGIALLTLPVSHAMEKLNGSGSTDWRAVVAINVAVTALVVVRLSILFAQVDRERRAAAAARHRFETVFETAGLPMTIGEGGKLARTNRAFQALLGYDGAELVGRPVSELFHPEDGPPVDPSTLGEEGRATFERRYLHRDGSVVHAVVNLTFSEDTGLSIAVIEDVTLRRQLEEQLLETQKLEAVGRLAGGIAHDFNNILTIVSGHTELLREHLPAEAEPDLDTILDAVRRANDLTKQLLTFSKRQAPAAAIIDPADIFRDTEILIRNVVGRSVALTTSIDASAPPVLADPTQLGQVALNLAVNARDAMPDGGTLTLAVERLELDEPSEDLPGVEPGLYCRLTVEDTGSGMDDETRTHLFEPFFTTKETGKGTGLGLATTYGIVTQAGGHIFVDSQLGRGSRFRILLPAAVTSAEPAVAETQAA